MGSRASTLRTGSACCCATTGCSRPPPELHAHAAEGAVASPPCDGWAAHVDPLFRYFRSLIEEAQEQGIVRPGRPEHLYYAMIGAASMPYAVAGEFRLLTGRNSDAKKLVEEHVETLLALFLKEDE